MGESYQQQIHESQDKELKKADEVAEEENKKSEKIAKDRNKKEGRSFIKGLFNKEKKPIKNIQVKDVDILHEQAKWEDAARRNMVGREKTGPVRITIDKKTGTYKKDKTDEEKMHAVREDINKILPDNYVKELTLLKEMRVANSSAYEMFVNLAFLQANGGKDVWGRKSGGPAHQFKEWTAEDCQELLKDLGEDWLLGALNNKSESTPAEEK